MKQKKEDSIGLNIKEFQSYFKDKTELIENEFFKKYIVTIKTLNISENDNLKLMFKNLIKALCEDSIEDIDKSFRNFISYNISHFVPYIIVSNSIIYLKRVFIEIILDKNSKELMMQFYKLYLYLENLSANEYLFQYKKKLLSRNKLRINSLNDVFEQTVIIYYKSHLEWLSKLTIAIIDESEGFPELNHTLCSFGKWLQKDGKTIIQNTNRYNNIVQIHKELHEFSKQIKVFLTNKDSKHIVLTFLEKCEMNSLSLGTELALVDNALMNKKISKDTLTGALTREKLKQLYQSQLEISFATSEPFVLAMCDLDFFKNINDSYGHLVGDKLLFKFVDLLKNELRTSDMIFRYGGEEFIIILPAIGYSKAYEILDDLRNKFSKLKIEVDEKLVGTTFSCGLLEINLENNGTVFFRDLDKIIEIMDKNLYQAKNSGRNRIC